MVDRGRGSSRWRAAASASVGVLAMLLLATPGWAGAPTDQLKSSTEQIIRVLEDPALKAEARTAERRAAIRKEAERVFDFEETARRALGRHWQTLSEADRREFVPLFADLLERAYISKIETYTGEQIAYTGETLESDLATVKTRFVTKKGTEIPIDYRMRRRDGDRWLVYDVNVEGISLVSSYRTQFDKIIRTASYQDLVAKMKSRDSELNAPAGQEKAASPKS